MLKIGLRAHNLPNEEESVVLVEHIYTNFGGHTAEEIKLAFEMAMAGKLELKPDEINCYENFSCLYFSRIMNAYRGWSSQAFKQLKTEPPPPIKIYSDQETEDLYRGDIEAFYQRLRNGRVPHALPDYFKPTLVKDGLMGKEEKLADFFTNRLGKGFENIYVKAEPI